MSLESVKYRLSQYQKKSIGTTDLFPLINDIENTVFLKTSITIPRASVLTLNSTPIVAIPAPGEGFALQVIAAIVRIASYGGTPYGTNTLLELIADTLINTQATDSDTLAANSSQIGVMGISAGGNIIIENKALLVKVANGNPTAGNSDIIIYLTYRLLTL